MCTAVTFQTKDFYIGRTLDYECSYGEEVTVTPRNYPFSFRHTEAMHTHYAIIGMACIIKEDPLYYDAVNEKGLGMAGLNFVGNAVYRKPDPARTNLAQFELIPYLLGQCASVEEARRLLAGINLTDTPFAEGLPPAQLHWILADQTEAITVEFVRDGMKIYDNPAGVLTNNPPFDHQMFLLNRYLHLSAAQPENTFCTAAPDRLPLQRYCLGLGALGLPGDLSSDSRFVRAAFTKMNSVCGSSEEESVSQFFHILGCVNQTRGCSQTGENRFEMTIYSSCCNASRGIYYYTTYGNRRITAVDMHREDLNGSTLSRYPVITAEQIYLQNENAAAGEASCLQNKVLRDSEPARRS